MDENLNTNPQPVSCVQPGLTPTLEKPIWQSDAFIVLLLVSFWPVGIIFMWLFASWRKWVKILLTIFAILPIILLFLVITFLISLFMTQQAKVVSYDAPPVVVETNDSSAKPLYLEDLKNGYTKVTSPRFKYSYEFPTDTKYILPFRQPSEGEYWGITFHMNDNFDEEAGYWISPTVGVTTLIDPRGSSWDSHKAIKYPEVNPSAYRSLQVPEKFSQYKNDVYYGISEDSETIEFFTQGASYMIQLTRKPSHIKSKGTISEEDITKAQKVYEHIVKTFTITE